MSNKKKPRIATEALTQKQPHEYFNVLGPVDKLKFLCIAAADASLSRCDLASLMTIANGVNSKTGITWRSSNTLAREIASTSRTVKRSIKKLVEKGYITITKKGNRGGKANTYSLGSIDRLTGSVADVTMFGDSSVTSAPVSSDVGVISHVSQMSPLSMTLSEPKARIERSRSYEGDALPCAVAIAPSGKCRPGEDIYPDFWLAYPLKAGVANAEAILSKLIKAGVSYQDIVDGAKRYAEYCKTSKKRTSADAWLERESWRDAWNSSPRKKIEKMLRGIFKGSDVRMTEKEIIKEAAFWNKEDQRRANAQTIHDGKCSRCTKYWEDEGDSINPSHTGLNLCPIGKSLQKEINYSSDRVYELENFEWEVEN